MSVVLPIALAALGSSILTIPSVKVVFSTAPLWLELSEPLPDLFFVQFLVDVNSNFIRVLGPVQLVALDAVQLLLGSFVELAKVSLHIFKSLALSPTVVLKNASFVLHDLDLALEQESVSQRLESLDNSRQLVVVDRRGHLQLGEFLNEHELEVESCIVLIINRTGPVSLLALLLWLGCCQVSLVNTVKLLHLTFC